MPGLSVRPIALGFCLSLVGSLPLACSFDSSGLTSATTTTTTTTTEAGSEATSESGESTGGCDPGELDCDCLPGGICEGELECISGVCTDPGPGETEGACSEQGCTCDDDEDCDPNLICDQGTCVPNTCGDGIIDEGEDCDDGNGLEGDGCDPDCSYTMLIDLSLGDEHTCVVFEGGGIRCWGSNAFGELGTGTPDLLGDDELPLAVPNLPFPPAEQVVAGYRHTCALFETGDVRCWGINSGGQLGYASGEPAIGDDESIDDLPPVVIGGSATGLQAGGTHTCARIDNQLRCWGLGTEGQLGLGSTQTIGDDEVPLDAAFVNVGASGAAAITLGNAHTCALSISGAVLCWGVNTSGQLGYGSTVTIGDNELPVDVGPVELFTGLPPDTTLASFGAGLAHTCVLLSSGAVRCWGENGDGQLGQGNTEDWGDGPGETPDQLPNIELGAASIGLAVGERHTCALLTTGDLRCWGFGLGGRLGYANTESIGDDELPNAAPTLALGGPAVRVVAGSHHTCAIRMDQSLLCWGDNDQGQLGYGNTTRIGDDEDPVDAGPVSLF